MNPDGVLPDEMERSIKKDDGLDPLDGSAVGAVDLARFAEDLRTAFPETPVSERIAEDHIAAMIGSIQLLADKGESTLEPTSNAYGPDRRASGLPKLRRRTMKERMIATLAVTMGLLLSLAGLANAGVLPDPIQGAVGNILGFEDNDADEGDQGDIDDDVLDDTDEGEQADIDDDAQDDVEEADLGEDVDEADLGEDVEEADQVDDVEGDDQGEDGDDQGEDADEADEADEADDADNADDADDADESDESDDEGSDE